MVMLFSILGAGLGCGFGYLAALYFPIFDSLFMRMAESGSSFHNDGLIKHVIVFGAMGFFLFLIIGLIANKNKKQSEESN